MNKKDIIKNVNEIYNRLEELQDTAEDLGKNLKILLREMETLPMDMSDFDEEEES